MSQKFYISATTTNKTENHYIYLPKPDELEEMYANNKGGLFTELQKEYGRCTGKVYIDNPDGTAIAIGWVFEQKKKYEDVPEEYIHETWVEVFTAEHEITIKKHRLEI